MAKAPEVWGPFTINTTLDAQTLVWESLIKEHPKVETFYFFLNKENRKQQEFMKTLQAVKTGDHLILEVDKQKFKAVQELKSTQYIQSDFLEFEALHEAAFPNTYYNAKTIVGRLNNECFLKVLKSDSNKMLGYAYYELDLEMEEAALHYFAISPIVQNQGYGTMLLKEVITEMFTFPQINELKLCVDQTNVQDNHVYFKVGFEKIDILYSYRLNVKDWAK